MKKSIKKMIEKSAYQDKVNPGRKKTPYQPLPRPRATSFKTGKEYSRAANKRMAREAIYT